MDNLDRYHRQMLLPQIGEAGQQLLLQSRALLVGCGALGSVVAEQLTRAGVGYLRIIDRDIVEMSNLQRQVLFGEADARAGLPKAIAAQKRLSQISSQITIEPQVRDLDADNVEELSRGCALIIDGTDNVETRYLLNDFAVRESAPWVYGACVGTEGRVMTIRPGMTPCLRCIFPEAPTPGELPTCDTAGVLGPVASVVGCLQAIAAIKLLTRSTEAVASELLTFDLWNNRIRAIDTRESRRGDCPTCARHQFVYLDAAPGELTAKLCGRNAVQVRPPRGAKPMNLDQVASKLRAVGDVERSPFLVRCELEDSLRLTVFCDGRLIVHGTSDPARARSVYARYLGA